METLRTIYLILLSRFTGRELHIIHRVNIKGYDNDDSFIGRVTRLTGTRTFDFIDYHELFTLTLDGIIKINDNTEVK